MLILIFPRVDIIVFPGDFSRYYHHSIQFRIFELRLTVAPGPLAEEKSLRLQMFVKVYAATSLAYQGAGAMPGTR